MTVPVRQPEAAPCPEAEKALALWRQLGLTERALDVLLTLPRGPQPPIERRAEPRAEGELPAPAAPAAPVEAAPPALHAPHEAAARRRLLLEARDVLRRLSVECEREAAALFGALIRAPALAPPGAREGPLVRPVVRAARDRRIGRSHGVLRIE